MVMTTGAAGSLPGADARDGEGRALRRPHHSSPRHRDGDPRSACTPPWATGARASFPIRPQRRRPPPPLLLSPSMVRGALARRPAPAQTLPDRDPPFPGAQRPFSLHSLRRHGHATSAKRDHPSAAPACRKAWRLCPAPSEVLVVEDEPDIRNLIALHLARDGFRCRTAATGAEALRAVKFSPPDLVILDLMLPEMDGLEVCRRLRQEPDSAAVPIIMLTAKTDEVDRVLGLEMGADDYVAKPFSPKELVARVRAVLRRTRPRRDRPVVSLRGPHAGPGPLRGNPSRSAARLDTQGV